MAGKRASKRPLIPAGSPIRFRFLSGIGAKLFLVLMLVSLATAGVVSYLQFGSLFSSIDRLELARLDDSFVRAEKGLAREGGEILLNAQDYSHWDEVYDPATGRDPTWLKINIDDWVPGHFGIDTIVMADRSGAVYHSITPPAELAVDVSSLPVFREALEGRESFGLYLSSRGLMLTVGAFISPADYKESGFPVEQSPGVLIYGRYIDSETAAGITSLTGQPVVFFDPDKLIGSSGGGEDAALGAPFSDISGEARLRIFGGEEMREETPDFLFLYKPLTSPDGQVVGAIRVGLDRSDVNSVRSRIFQSILISLVFGLAFALVLSVFLGMRLVRPIRELARLMVEYAAGKPIKFPKVRRSDELGALTSNFIFMAESIEKSRLEVLRHEAELRKINQSLRLSSADLTRAKAELENKVRELEKMNRAMVGREMRMIELKKEMAELRKENEEREKGGGN